MNDRFLNKTVILTGASAGVGAEAARQFAAEGARLVLIARGTEALEAIAAELAAQTEVLAIPLDVRDQPACTRMLEQAEARFGRIDVLVNNAGHHKRGPVRELAAEDLAPMIEVNLTAPVALTRAVLPYLEKSGGGAVVNVASLTGKMPIVGAATYSATKFGLRAFSIALAEELREANIDIAVSLVSPGPIDTGFIMDQMDEVEDITFSQPMSTASDVAAAILDAAAGESREIAMPRSSSVLATLGYLFPSFARKIRPALRTKGARVKEKLRARMGRD